MVSTPAGANALALARLDISGPLSLPVQTADRQELNAGAQLEKELVYTDLQSFSCHEEMQRFEGTAEGEQSRQIDTVTSKVSFENGSEHYSDIRQDRRARSAISSLPGAWSQGEFGTLLRQTRALLGTKPITLEREGNLNGTPAAEYVIRVAQAESPWSLTMGARQYTIPFDTRVWVSKARGQMLSIERTSTGMPPDTGISRLRWAVNLEPTRLESSTWLLPKSGWYEVRYANSDRKDWNLLSFSEYHQYGAQGTLHF
jgi:hypothetical protein